jgi:hypothetical protein
MNNGPHLTTDGISAAFEELLPEREQRAADAHLAGCARCQAVLDELIGVRRALHQIGGQTPAMPPAVQDRLEAVLAAESMARQQSGVHTAPRPASAPQRGPRPTGRGSHRSKHVAPRSKPHSRKRSHSRSRGGAGRIFAAAAGLVVLAVGSLVTYQTLFAGQQQPANVVSQPSPSASKPAPHPADDYHISKQSDLTTQNFAAGVEAAVTFGKTPKSAKPSPRFGIRNTTPTECAEQVVRKAGHQPLSSAATTFNGSPAVLVIAKSKTPNSVDAYVVTGCPRKDASIVHGKTVAISN